MKIQNQVFQQSQQHVDSMNAEVAHYWDEYSSSNEDTEHKRGISSLMKSDFATFETNNLTSENKQHLQTMESGE